MIIVHDRDAQAIGGGFEEELAGIELVYRGGAEIADAGGLLPGGETVGQIVVDEEGLLRELGRIGLVAEFRRISRLGEISVQAYNPMAATDAIHSGECDFTFTIMDPRIEIEGLHVEAIADDHLILITSERVPPGGEVLTPEIISGLPFVSAQAGMPRREIEEHLLERYGIRRRHIVLEFGHAESLKQAVRRRLGSSRRARRFA